MCRGLAKLASMLSFQSAPGLNGLLMSAPFLMRKVLVSVSRSLIALCSSEYTQPPGPGDHALVSHP